MIIGLTGRIASGKGEVAEYFVEKGFVYASLSNAVREEAGRRNIEVTRKNLQDLGNLVRESEGAGAWARRIVSMIDRSKNYVIDGIRNPAEIYELKKIRDFYLIAVDAQQKIRFRRVLERNKESDPKTWEDFLIADNRDFGEEFQSGQQVGKCMEMADFLIRNDSSLEEFYSQLNKIYHGITRMN